MSPRRSDSRERMVRSTTELLRAYGVGATSLDRVLAHSGAPRGSLYHHFPGGRTQLLEEAVALAGDVLDRMLAKAAAGDPVDALFGLWRDQLLASEFRAGCPVAAVVVDADDDTPQLARAAAEIFRRWQDVMAELLVGRGLPEARARRLASFTVSAVEGALILCRAERSTAPLDDAAAEVRELVEHALRQGT
ncbi:TetR/AcrR family transcriptional regulator [Kutzneria buriramensis]|uniref:AcrR family transcriptional regulator n=1 Tax=Kutzneria buriramensis TaxID=1045776 RepID=A0A3E0GT13_9PSEU|nr:TetR/AcrR family transcriptional regulator [Kutzneria buriramensis]REH26186.1 AcrR family transcriptional regulator [Kutzneria buriramensis]